MKERLLLILTAIIFLTALVFMITGIVVNSNAFRSVGFILILAGNIINLVVQLIRNKKEKCP